MQTLTDTMVLWVLYIWLWYSGTVTGTGDVSEILQAMPSYIAVKRNNSRISYDERTAVIVNNYETHVYLYTNNYVGTKYVGNRVHAFYAAMSCTFAVWTTSHMYDFVASSTAFFQRHSVNGEENGIADFKTSLIDKVRDFVNILNLFINGDWAGSRYRDWTVLNAFLAIEIKFSNALDADGIVHAVLEEMIRLRRYLAVNCAQPDINTNRHPKQLFGYWTQPLGTMWNWFYINNYLGMLHEIIDKDKPDSVTNTEMCTVQQTFLENFIEECTGRFHSLDINGTKVYVTPEINTTVGEIRERILMSYDVELMFWLGFRRVRHHEVSVDRDRGRPAELWCGRTRNRRSHTPRTQTYVRRCTKIARADRKRVSTPDNVRLTEMFCLRIPETIYRIPEVAE